CDDSRADLVRWIEVFSHSLRLNATPLSIAEIFRRQLDGHPRAWIFTSATLAVAGDFSHYRSEMGLDKARTACWDSPFDYAAQALLYVPKKLPDPNSDEHTRAVVAASLPVIRASGGSAFLLFTTLRAMRLAHELLREEFRRQALGFPLMLQGEGSRSELLERFRRLGNAVLSVARASGKAWTCAGTRSRSWSSTSCRLRLPMTRYSRRGSNRSSAKAAIPSSATNCLRRSFP